MAVLWLVLSVKLVCEVALMAWLGRAVLGLLVPPAARATNPFYRLLSWVVHPAQALAGRWAPAWCLLAWLLATLAKLRLCLALGAQACH